MPVLFPVCKIVFAMASLQAAAAHKGFFASLRGNQSNARFHTQSAGTLPGWAEM